MSRVINIVVTIRATDKLNSNCEKLLYRITRYKYNQVAIRIDGNWVTVPVGGKVSLQEPDVLRENWFTIYIANINITEETYVNIKNFIAGKLGKKDNWLGVILGNYLGIGFNAFEKNRYHSAELVTIILQMLSLPSVRELNPLTTTPTLLANKLIGDQKGNDSWLK